MTADYLAGLPPEQAEALRAVNAPGLRALREYLAAGQAVAFLGGGVSAPLYPLWGTLIGELVDAAVDEGLADPVAQTCRSLAGSRPDSVVEVLRRQLGETPYHSALRHAFRVRRDQESGRTWTPTHELVCRCPFKAVVTTNYDPGIVDARMRVRPRASGTGFASWTDELALDRWRSGDVFGDDELPVLFAHGHHNQPDAMVLATTEYRRAYAGKLASVLGRLVESAHLVWIGFGFADQRIGAVLREVAERTGRQAAPASDIRHVAVMGWCPDGDGDPGTLRTLAEIEYGARLVLYPARGADHSALGRLLADLVDERYPPVTDPVPSATRSIPPVPVRWAHGAEEARVFTGRAEELARLDRWAADPTVRLVGVTAWGGAGKTALVSHWVQRTAGPARRTGARGVFAWSFYADPSADRWAEALLAWAAGSLGWRVAGQDRAAAVAALARAVPLVLVLDGLEVMQDGPASDAFGRLLDGTLREVLTALCRTEHASLAVLTSRFPFADVAGFDGTSARMLDVPPFTPAEGAAVLDAAGPGALHDAERRELVAEVDGHALAVAAMAALLAEHPGATADLRSALAVAGRTQEKVGRVLAFYAETLPETHRYLAAAVSLFARPVTPEQVLAIAGHETFGGRLDGWDAHRVRAAAHGPLAGLLSWHPSGTVSAHPLVRATFRPLALGAAETAAEATLADAPAEVSTRAEGLLVVEAIELLLDAGQWTAADELYRARTDDGRVWKHIPAARLGQRASMAFVGSPHRERHCRDDLGPRRCDWWINGVGLHAMNAGDLDIAQQSLDAVAQLRRPTDNPTDLAVVLRSLAECLGQRGQARDAHAAASESLAAATNSGEAHIVCLAHAACGWAQALSGHTDAAEEHFTAGDRIEYQRHSDHTHLYSVRGTRWGEFLARTGRRRPARRLIDGTRRIAEHHGWNEDAARCRLVLARLDLLDGDFTSAREHTSAAVACFRGGDYLVELAGALTVAAEVARRVGDLDTAEDHATEALTFAVPRGLVPIQASALAARACIFADRFTATGDAGHLHRGRDAAEAALRLSTGTDPLPWHELEALQAHAHLDRAEGAIGAWARRADELHHRLVPPGLDPDPLATVEAEFASER